MNSSSLLQAVYDRLRADTGSGGLLGTPALVGGVYVVRAPDSATLTLPYIVIDIAGMSHSDSFSADYTEWEFRTHVFASYISGIAGVQTVTNRVYGDAVAQPSRVPSYGLHRHVLVPAAVSGFTHSATGITHIDSILLDSEPEVYHSVDTYRVGIERRA